MPFTVTCKHCGSDNIVEQNLIPGSCGVTSWKMEGGVPVADEYDGGTDVHWDGQTPVTDERGHTMYWCRGCDRELGTDELVVSGG